MPDLLPRYTVDMFDALPDTPGEIRVGNDTSLLPDILVYPARFPLGIAWKDVTEWRLAIEIVSRSSAIYDRDYERRAYAAVGVREYWVVDARAHAVEIRHPGDTEPRVARERVVYQTPGASSRPPSTSTPSSSGRRSCFWTLRRPR